WSWAVFILLCLWSYCIKILIWPPYYLACCCRDMLPDMAQWYKARLKGEGRREAAVKYMTRWEVSTGYKASDIARLVQTGPSVSLDNCVRAVSTKTHGYAKGCRRETLMQTQCLMAEAARYYDMEPFTPLKGENASARIALPDTQVLKMLLDKTQFNEGQIRAFFHSAESDWMSRELFDKIMVGQHLESQMIHDRIWAILDKTDTDKAYIPDLVVFVGSLTKGSDGEVVDAFFGIFDVKGDGRLSPDEVISMYLEI
ncbi:hypothetical protein KIPB_012896, partial [Kipferlia bialata]